MTFSRSICSAGYTFNIVKAERRGVPMSRKRVLSRLRALLQRSQVHVVSGNTQMMRSNVCTFLNIALLACSKQEAALAGTTQLASALRISSNLRRHRRSSSRNPAGWGMNRSYAGDANAWTASSQASNFCSCRNTAGTTSIPPWTTCF